MIVCSDLTADSDCTAYGHLATHELVVSRISYLVSRSPDGAVSQMMDARCILHVRHTFHVSIDKKDVSSYGAILSLP